VEPSEFISDGGGGSFLPRRVKRRGATFYEIIKFEDCYKARIEVEIQGIKINFIDLENLKHNKRATGRPQDLADAVNLE